MSDETTLRDLDEAIERIDDLEQRVTWLEKVVSRATDYNPPRDNCGTATVKDVVRELEENNGDPVPIEYLVDVASDRLDVSRGTVRAEIKQLRRRGEIYDACDEAVRVT